MVTSGTDIHNTSSTRPWYTQAPSNGERYPQCLSRISADGGEIVNTTRHAPGEMPISSGIIPPFRRSVQPFTRTFPFASVTSAPHSSCVQDRCVPLVSQGCMPYHPSNLMHGAPTAVMSSPVSSNSMDIAHSGQGNASLNDCYQPLHRECGINSTQEVTQKLGWRVGRTPATSSESLGFGGFPPDSPRPVFHHHEAPARLWNSPVDLSFQDDYVYPEPFTLMMQGNLLSPGNKLSKMCPSYWSTYGEQTNTVITSNSNANFPNANNPTYAPTSANYSFQTHLNDFEHNGVQQEFSAPELHPTAFVHTDSRDVAFTPQIQHHLQHVASNGTQSSASLSSHDVAISACGCSSCDAPLTPFESSNSASSCSYPASTTSHYERVLSYQRTDTPESAFSETATSHHDVSSSSESDRSPSKRLSNKRASQYELLLRWKGQGMSYRQIKAKGNFKEAESTLRGRYRTLTKPKETRVRRPVWKPVDIELLKEAVEYYEEEKREHHARNGTECPSETSRAAKTPWKKVAKYIADRGGTYHFGNATCRKKWDEICKQV